MSQVFGPWFTVGLTQARTGPCRAIGCGTKDDDCWAGVENGRGPCCPWCVLNDTHSWFKSGRGSGRDSLSGIWLARKGVITVAYGATSSELFQQLKALGVTGAISEFVRWDES